MTPQQIAAARAHFAAVEPRLAPLIPAAVPERYALGGHYQVLCNALVNQQLSSRAAASIAARVRALTAGDDFPEPAAMAALDPAVLRACGLSSAKVRYMQALAGSVMSGELDLDSLDALDDATAVDRLTTVPGIGRWTAEMMLIFGMGRPDVMPWLDLAIREGLRRHHDLAVRPGEAEVLALTEAWRPWRSAGALALWRSLDTASAI